MSKKSKLHPLKRQKCYDRDGGRCGYCGVELTFEESTIDHITPRSAGGGYIYENLLLACLECNQSKEDMEVEDFRRFCYYVWVLGVSKPPTVELESALVDKFGIFPDYTEVRFWYEDHEPLLDPRSEMCYVD